MFQQARDPHNLGIGWDERSAASGSAVTQPGRINLQNFLLRIRFEIRVLAQAVAARVIHTFRKLIQLWTIDVSVAAKRTLP